MTSSSSVQAIDQHSRITLFFSLSTAQDELIDSNFERTPGCFVYGEDALPPGFQPCLLGLVAGDERSFTLAPEQGFGQPHPDNVQTFSREQFGQTYPLALGLVVAFQDAAGNEVNGVVTGFDAQQVSVDFNHPLAGKTLIWRVKIVSVEQVSHD